MLRKLNIGPRLLMLLGVQGVLLLAIGVFTLAILRNAVDTSNALNEKVSQEAALIALSDSVRSDVLRTVYGLNVGNVTWPEARETLALAQTDFESGWSAFLEDLSPADRELVDDVLAPHVDGVRGAFEQLGPILQSQNRGRLSLFASNDLEFLVGPFLNALVASTYLQQIEAEAAAAGAVERSQQFLYTSIALVLGGVLAALVLGLLIYRSIASPLSAISETVQRVSEGDFDARTGVEGTDELGTLGVTFDQMLSERVATLSHAQEENERLNDSVISLLEAVSQLSRRDLRVKVPVTEDVTGPVADSLNLLTSETAKVLQGVRVVSENVAVASAAVKAQSDEVIGLAKQERQEVEQTASALSSASAHMTRIAKLAHACAAAADKAIGSTQTAMETVNSTVGGINNIRDTIRETEKRIKRLGERSQEITGVVNLINTIAERTHILALNASMHAASAGEAGRGFAVVADEVQRLAENARDATAQISTLVSNIQVETSDTVATMNEVIAQVVDGSRLAEQAGRQMHETESSTAELVGMVQKIAAGSKNQARTNIELHKRARGIQKSTEDTSEQLLAQSERTLELVEHARELLDAVGVFQLPDAPTGTETVAPDRAAAAG